MNKNIILILLIAGFGCLVFAAIAPTVVNEYTVDSSTHAAILDNSETSVNQSTIKTFHLDPYQEMKMKIYVYVNETSITEDILNIIILSAKNYNTSQNADPSGISTGLITFNVDTLAYPPTATPSWQGVTNFKDVTSVTPGVHYTATLSGTTSTTSKPVPGDFYIIIWNEDTSTPDGSTLYYDLEIKQDHLGVMLAPWFAIIGLALLAVGAVLGVIYLRKR